MHFFSHLNEASCRNNAGAHYIDTNRFDEAINMITGALQEFRLIQHSFPQDLAQIQNPITLQEEKIDESEEDYGRCVFVYKRPIRIQQGSEPTSSTMVSFILIFNLALAYHLKSATTTIHQRTAQMLLQKSRSLYELAYQLMVSKPEAFSVRVSLVLSNNLGQVLQSMEVFDKARECFSHVLSTVMYLKDIGMDGEVPEISEFLRSTTHLVLEQATAAAA
jgi:tetratricopeptide (TPR) repeat protein